MGAYRDDFQGFFHVALDRRWRQMPLEATTAVAQSRAVYLNAEAFRASGEGRFRKAVEQGAAFLVRYFEDERGGFYWEVTPEGQPANRLKQGYGNVHALFALAHAYGVLGDPVYLDAAWRQLGVLQRYFADPVYPGGIRPGLSADFGATVGVNNVDVFTHYFEALLALHDVVTGSRREDVAHLIRQAERFLSGQLYHDEQGRTDRGYVAYNYTAAWEPAQAPYTFATQWSGAMHATPAHGIELAFLLSRAVERGFDPGWLRVADKMLRFAEVHCFDEPTGGSDLRHYGLRGSAALEQAGAPTVHLVAAGRSGARAPAFHGCSRPRQGRRVLDARAVHPRPVHRPDLRRLVPAGEAVGSRSPKISRRATSGPSVITRRCSTPRCFVCTPRIRSGWRGSTDRSRQVVLLTP